MASAEYDILPHVGLQNAVRRRGFGIQRIWAELFGEMATCLIGGVIYVLKYVLVELSSLG